MIHNSYNQGGWIPDHFMKVKLCRLKSFFVVWKELNLIMMMRFSNHFSVQSAASCLLSHFLKWTYYIKKMMTLVYKFWKYSHFAIIVLAGLFLKQPLHASLVFHWKPRFLVYKAYTDANEFRDWIDSESALIWNTCKWGYMIAKDWGWLEVVLISKPFNKVHVHIRYTFD